MRLRSWASVLGAAIIVLGLLTIGLAYLFMGPLVDLWWFDSLHYAGYFWQRLFYRYIVFVCATLLFFLIFFLNFWVASRYLGTTTPPPSLPRTRAWRDYRELVKMFRTGSMDIYTLLSIILAIVIAYPLFKEWEATLLFVFGPASGIYDPTYGNDISFYLFAYPIYELLLHRLLYAFLILSVSLVVLYLLEHRMLSRQDTNLAQGAKIHICAIIFITFLIGVWGLFLQRYQLLYTTTHLPLFYGPGFVEMWTTLPLIWFSFLSLFAMAVASVYFIYTRKGLLFVGITAAIFLAALGVRYSSFLPTLSERYIVKPNELYRERLYIERNIDSTLNAYNLHNIEIRDYGLPEIPWDTSAPEVKVSIRNIPLWDGELLHKVFEQLQEIRTYYNFPSVDVDRYTVNGVYQQVFLAGRELNLTQLQEGAKTWVNLHLKYTHGYGAVMIPAAQGGEEPMTWFLQGIPPESDYGLTIAQPGIYFGNEPDEYVIVPNGSHEIDHPVGDSNVLTDFKGNSGIPVASLFKKFIFAAYFKDRNIFFTTSTDRGSQLLFRRNITQRIQTLTPFFMLDKDPYLVVTPGKMFWIQDAYTYSHWFPYSQPYSQQINYIRNSVKIIIDAYTGEINYYIADPLDPIIRAYNRIYPGLLKPLSAVPEDLKPHLRYPRDIFEVQMSIYNKYHQTDPQIFYNQEDTWEFPVIQRLNKQPSRMVPYYMTLNLIDRTKFEFLVLSAVTPKGRDNLRALVVAGSDGANYGRLVVYNFPKGQLVYGPPQIDALIDQDTFISQQFTLWNQVGSQVDRGKMIVLPVGKAIVYIQPVYLIAAGRLQIPELKRIIVTQGDTVVMETSLEEGFRVLGERIAEKASRVQKRLQQMPPPTQPPQVVPGNEQQQEGPAAPQH